ncbi:UAP1 [Cordylochernes scorpioides]|uniref:UDP-N-acetylglucosamine diphosphorylase n=1 Tax=Cordylochernes scorpioides TaxID=51811 RepID=A0ABY6KBB7_9ARAC|nr:UAP1 [Cordylochernes scorpioides]
MLEDDKHTGRPSSSKTPESIEKVREFVANNRSAFLRMMAEVLHINKETIRTILHEDLGLLKTAADQSIQNDLTRMDKSKLYSHYKDIHISFMTEGYLLGDFPFPVVRLLAQVRILSSFFRENHTKMLCSEDPICTFRNSKLKNEITHYIFDCYALKEERRTLMLKTGQLCASLPSLIDNITQNKYIATAFYGFHKSASMYEELCDLLEKHQQQHLLRFWEQLSEQERTALYKDLKSINYEKMQRLHQTYYKKTNNHVEGKVVLEPIPEDLYDGVRNTSPEQLAKYWKTGLEAIRAGKVAALLLAGGQGTRLGVPYPKGMYNVSLLSGKTLYQLQAERILRLQHLSNSIITWYIMTSEHTKDSTVAFLKKNDYFGIDPDNICIFEQNMIPCLDYNGKMLLDTKYRVARAPDGNGGLYDVLASEGIIADMKQRGIEHVHVYCVDNILVRIADPWFLGYCISKKANCGAKVVKKQLPDEAVGVVCKVNNKFKVVEYSELPTEYAEKVLPDSGDLVFRAGNICNHYFNVDFLEEMSRGIELQHHVAIKKIPYLDQDGNYIKPADKNGIKLEKFVFDVFEYSDYMEVPQVNHMNVSIAPRFERMKQQMPSSTGSSTLSKPPAVVKEEILFYLIGWDSHRYVVVDITRFLSGIWGSVNAVLERRH